MFNVAILKCSSQLIHLHVSSTSNNDSFYVTFVYGMNDEEGRNILWKELQALAMTSPWIVLGDFNDILSKEEQIAILTVYPELISGRKPFKYFQMWNSFSGFQELVHADWSRPVDGTMMYIVVHKLKRLKGTLRIINKQGFSNIHAAELEAFHSLTDCQNMLSKDPLNPNLIQKEIEARQKYYELHRSYCSFLQQKAKIKWSQEGDSNTALFHASIRERSCQNRIYSITTDSGDWVDKPDQVSAAFLDYYQSLLGSKLALRTKVIKRVVHQGAILTSEQANSHLLPYSKEEVQKAIWEIPGTKAPGPNCYGIEQYYSDPTPEKLRSIFPMLIAQNEGGFFKGRILDASGYTRSHLPFKYLGVPICSKRSLAKDCQILLDRMLARLKCWSSRHIFFVGRVILINSVLLSIHCYWNQIMIIPAKILKEISAMCRAFLWSGQASLAGPGRLAWDSVCQSKKVGGLGFKNSTVWNIAAIGKYVWAVAEKKDNLWVKWVHDVLYQARRLVELLGPCF
ncbi:uncharacterized protein LOC133785194 [Humulus lupulus]|uniref:uncharacterized protein LOC133785194 n=1 Tax=Humulus lupulus TaxID=3486 RepID=UPI002B41141C|nr:uncharacterized protein LOC133785194 [Humulus lupulus]